MWPESRSRSVRAGDAALVKELKGTRCNHVVLGTLQDSLNKHDPAVILASRCRPQGAPAGPLNLFRYLRANLPYFKLNQGPTGDRLYCCTPLTQQIHHNTGSQLLH